MTRLVRFCLALKLDDGPAKELERLELDVIDEAAARTVARHMLQQRLDAGYPAERLLLGWYGDE